MITPNLADFYCFCDLVIESVEAMSLPSHNFPWLPGFEECTTDYERIKKFMSMSFLIFDQLSAMKNDSIAKEKREHGNKAWRNNKISLALRFYTEAIFCASGCEEKALGYGNRSCVLSRIGVHEAVLQDIDLAIKHNYPKDRRPRLLIRRAQSLLSLKRHQEALTEYNNCLQYIKCENLSIPTNLSETIQVGIKNCSAISEDSSTGDPVIPFFVHDAKSLVLKNDANQGIIERNNSQDNNVPAYSLHPRILRSLHFQNPPATKLNYNNEFGWHIVATKTIQPDYYSIVIVVLNDVSILYHAETVLSEVCEQAAWNPIWTENNDNSVSLESTTNSSLPCHRFECGIIDRLIVDDYAGWKRFRNKESSKLMLSMKRWKPFMDKLSDDDIIGGPNISWLSYAILARTAPSTLNRLIEFSLGKLTCQTDAKHAIEEELLSFTGHRVIPQNGWNDYTTIGWLITNSNKREPSDLWQRTVAAVYLTFCLEASGYPITRDNDCSQSNYTLLPFTWASTCMLHHLQCISSNGHSLSLPEYIFSENNKPRIPGIDLNKLSSIEISTCLYPVLSLINHSCDPNVTNITINEFQCAICAIRPIEQNEIIYGNYGFHYAVHSLTERQNGLRSHKPSSKNVHYCHCNQSIQLKSLSKFQKLVYNDLFTKFESIPSIFQKTSPKKLKNKFLNKFIVYTKQMLDKEHLHNILQKPCTPLDWLQELLKQLLDLQYTAWSYEKFRF
ncbi:SET and MYND domain-containing protein 4 [Schistosoma japonicum]|nr:SET and MYND domain-containing protein 4 [Schistosoma japonicum]